MSANKKPQEKSRLHPRNKNRERYDLDALIHSTPELKNFVKPNKFGDESVDFSNPAAVKMLNKALLHHYYGIKYWTFSDENLCPPIPGRADYMHYMADLLCESNFGRIPNGNNITCLDIGVGANVIYPILASQIYDWNMVGCDIHRDAIKIAMKNIRLTKGLSNLIDIRYQDDPANIFKGILKPCSSLLLGTPIKKAPHARGALFIWLVLRPVLRSF